MERNEELRRIMLAQQGYSTVSPNVEYIEYILPRETAPNLPPDLSAVAYDNEFALTNISEKAREWARLSLMRQIILYKNNRPSLAGNPDEDIRLATLPVKQYMKLSRSVGGFERRQETTQTEVRIAAVPEGAKVRRGVLTRLGLRKPKPMPEGAIP